MVLELSTEKREWVQLTKAFGRTEMATGYGVQVARGGAHKGAGCFSHRQFEAETDYNQPEPSDRTRVLPGQDRFGKSSKPT